MENDISTPPPPPPHTHTQKKTSQTGTSPRVDKTSTPKIIARFKILNKKEVVRAPVAGKNQNTPLGCLVAIRYQNFFGDASSDERWYCNFPITQMYIWEDDGSLSIL